LAFRVAVFGTGSAEWARADRGKRAGIKTDACPGPIENTLPADAATKPSAHPDPEATAGRLS